MVNPQQKEASASKTNCLLKILSQSLVALRRIEDHMRYSEQCPETIKVPNKMNQRVKEAHSHYQSKLLKQRAEKEDTQKSLKRKIVSVEIKAVEEKRLKLVNKIRVLCVDADLLATKAEKLLNFKFLKQANQKRRIADDKQRKIKELEDIKANLLKKC